MKRSVPMRSTPLRSKAPPPRPVKTTEYEPRPRAAAVAVTDTRARLVVPIPKRGEVRSKTLREAYRLIPCQFDGDAPGGICGKEDGTVCCCHSNAGSDGKGMAQKADDNRAAAGCHACHAELDQGKTWTAEEKRARFLRAHRRSVALLIERGLWPLNVEVPPMGAA